MDQLLRHFGFSDQEIDVYKTLLKTGGATVSQIARLTGRIRTSCQEYVISLEEKGFINSAKIGNKFFYQAEDPDKFRQMINERLFTLERLTTYLHNKKLNDAWEVKTVSREEKRLALQRARKKGQKVIEFGNQTVGGAVLESKVLLHCPSQDIPALEIFSGELASFHQELLQKK